jgi:hypothetical protein
MKKAFILFAIAVFAISCTTDFDDTKIKTIELKVNSNDWVENVDKDGINLYYSSTFNIPEITSRVYSEGSVNVYITNDNSQQILPFVRHYENIDGIMWTRTIDYDYAVGKINIYVTNSDFYKEKPETMTFRVVLIYQ